MIIDMPTVSMGNSGSILPADKVSYSNTTSGLEADNVQDAIDEVKSDLDSKGTIYRSSNTEQKIVNSTVVNLTDITLTKGKYVIELDMFGTCTSNLFFTVYLGTSDSPYLYQFRMYGDTSPTLTQTIVYEITDESQTLTLSSGWASPAQDITVGVGNARIIAIKLA